MNVRRTAATLAVVAMTGLAGLGSAPAALGTTPRALGAAGQDDAPSPSASAAPKLPAGLFGSSDPTYDGVFRQSYALLAQHTVGEHPAAQAVDWLTGQQCANGGFTAYRSDLGKACDTKAAAGAPSTAPDTNSTAAAVQALSALSAGQHKDVIGKAVGWLASAQNSDGGWGYFPGLPSDANSTGIVIGALAGAGEDPGQQRSAKGGKSPYDALAALALPCAQGGAFGLRDAKSGKLAANADATAAGVLGGLGKGAVVNTAGKPGPKAACEDAGKATVLRAVHNGAGYLHAQLARTPYLKQSLPGAKDQPDYGNTADAVIALTAAGDKETAGAAARWLAEHAGPWAKQSGPAAYAGLILAAHAAGTDPRHFGSTDLVAALNATGPAPHGSGASPAKGAEDSEDGGNLAHDTPGSGTPSAWWIIGVCLVAGIGIGLLLTLRKAGRRP